MDENSKITLMWLWPKDGWNKVDADKVATDFAGLGCMGIIPQASLSAPEWVKKNRSKLEAKGLFVVTGLGVDGAIKQPNGEQKIIDAILASLDASGSCMVDWEGAWEGDERRAAALRIAERVMELRPDVLQNGIVYDCPWWAPFSTPAGTRSHPRAATREWGAICSLRFVQAYGAPKSGQSEKMYAHAVKQYRDLYGEVTSQIRPAFQAYKRTAEDALSTLLAFDQGPIAIWDYVEMDREARLALTVAKELHNRNLWGTSALSRFKAASGLAVGGGISVDVLKALGLPVPF